VTVIAVVLIAINNHPESERHRLLARVADVRIRLRADRRGRSRQLLLVFARRQPFSALVDTASLHIDGGYCQRSSLCARAMFCYYGFEACATVAEETPDASRTIPKSMRLLSTLAASRPLGVLGFVLAVARRRAVLSGKDKDPIVTALKTAMGETGLRLVIAIVTVSSYLRC